MKTQKELIKKLTENDEVGLLKAIALMQYNRENYFLIEDEDTILLFEGEESEAKEIFDGQDDEKDFIEFCKSECTEIETIEEDEERDNYIVLTDDEADEKAKQSIEDSLWAFNAEFIIGECGLDFSGVDSLRKMQKTSCEGANDFIRSLIDKCTDIDSFVEAAISADGRGHFLNTYDGNENEEGVGETMFFIYRMN